MMLSMERTRVVLKSLTLSLVCLRGVGVTIFWMASCLVWSLNWMKNLERERYLWLIAPMKVLPPVRVMLDRGDSTRCG